MNEPQWIKASQSAAQGECVEMAAVGDEIHVRDSKDPNGPVLRYTKTEFATWIDAAKAGGFDDLL